jgi:hypothetical protein
MVGVHQQQRPVHALHHPPRHRVAKGCAEGYNAWCFTPRTACIGHAGWDPAQPRGYTLTVS